MTAATGAPADVNRASRKKVTVTEILLGRTFGSEAYVGYPVFPLVPFPESRQVLKLDKHSLLENENLNPFLDFLEAPKVR